jgi:hypothetical protein
MIVGRRRIVAEEKSDVNEVSGACPPEQNGRESRQEDGKKQEAQDVPAYSEATETVTYTWGRELYSFQQFTNVEVGPYSATTSVRAGETRTQAYSRVAAEVTAFAEGSRKAKLDSYKRALKGDN